MQLRLKKEELSSAQDITHWAEKIQLCVSKNGMFQEQISEISECGSDVGHQMSGDHMSGDQITGDQMPWKSEKSPLSENSILK